MDYRYTSPADNGYDNEDDEFNGMRDYVLTLMERSGPHDLVDSLLIIANICEHRVLLFKHEPARARWYARLSLLMRGALEMMNRLDDAQRPQAKLENPMLYYPVAKVYH